MLHPCFVPSIVFFCAAGHVLLSIELGKWRIPPNEY